MKLQERKLAIMCCNNTGTIEPWNNLSYHMFQQYYSQLHKKWTIAFNYIARWNNGMIEHFNSYIYMKIVLRPKHVAVIE
jgi:hypothetical protein